MSKPHKHKYLFIFQGFQKRIDTIKSTFAALYAEIKTECEKYGEDVKYLADFTGGCKKFEPWIQKSEAKKSVGVIKPKDLQEGLDQLEDAKVSYFLYRIKSGNLVRKLNKQLKYIAG